VQTRIKGTSAAGNGEKSQACCIDDGQYLLAAPANAGTTSKGKENASECKYQVAHVDEGQGNTAVQQYVARNASTHGRCKSQTGDTYDIVVFAFIASGFGCTAESASYDS